MADIFDDDDLDLLDDIDTSIYAVKHVSQKKDKELPDEIASRKPCDDFFRYEKFFQDIHKVLPTKMVMKERMVQESDAKVGQVFILNGLLCLVDRNRDYQLQELLQEIQKFIYLMIVFQH